MNMAQPGGSGTEVVTQETLLLEAVERLSRLRDGRVAYHLHLSRLRPQNRQDGHLRIALRMLDPMVDSYRGQMFLLSNSDIVFWVKNASPNDVDNLIYRLRALFSKDPLTFADRGDGRDNFASVYDLMYDYEPFLEMAHAALAEQRRRAKEAPPPAEAERLSAKTLGPVMNRLAIADLSRLIKRQSAIVVTEQGKAVVLFQEFFFYIADLQKALSPDVNLFSNRWLFQHLSLALDTQVLASLQAIALTKRPATYGLNLNIASADSPAFAAFERFAMASDSKISIELQVLDILSDSRGYFALRDRLQGRGHQIVIDGLNEVTLRFMDVKTFGADLYKVIWSPEWKEPAQESAISQTFRHLGNETIVMARCDSESAISWGLDHEIHRFQGRYVDAILAAYTMNACDKASACTLAQCIARHGVIGGPLRDECGNHAMLDSAPVIAVARPKKRAAAAS